MLKLLKVDVVTGKLTEENFIVAVSKLVNIGTLRNKAPEWANQAIKQLCPTMNGANIIKYAWYRLYMKYVDGPGVSRCCHYSHSSA